MSSPFRIFRKHQKVLLAVACLLAMISFVFLPIVLDRITLLRGGKDTVVVSTKKYGDLKEADLHSLRQNHNAMLSMLAGITTEVLGVPYDQARTSWESRLGGARRTETEIVDHWLLVRKAEEIGLSASDDAVMNFLMSTFRKEELGLSQTKMKALYSQSGINELTFFQLMREELMAQELQIIYGTSVQSVTPIQRWNYFCQLNQKAKIECIPVEVKSFTDQIKSPGESALKAFFEKHKGTLALPNLPEPGFRNPQKVEIEYFKAEVDKFAAANDITDDEIQTYYEKDAAFYDKKVKESIEREIEKETKKSDKDTPKKDETKTDATSKEPSADTQPAESDKQPASPENAKKDDVKKEDVQPEGEKKDEVKKDEVKKDEVKKDAQPADKAEPKSSSSTEPLPVRQVSYLADEPKNATPATPPADTSATKPDAAAPKAEAPKTEVPADKEKAKEAQAETASDKATETKATAPAQTDPSKEEASKPRRKLPEDVRKLIRERIAQDRISDVFTKLGKLMDEYSKEWKSYNSAKRHKGSNAVLPKKFDFEKYAAENGLTVGRTGLITLWDLQDNEIGSSYIEGFQRYAVHAFDTRLTLYSNTVSYDLKNNMYLAWKIQNVAESEPKWDDAGVQKNVLEWWKKVEARKLAEKKANELAEQARKTKGTLNEVFVGDKNVTVVSPKPFSWLNVPFIPNQSPIYRLSDVENVPMAGQAFMQKVFTSETSEIGVALDQPQTIAYVIQVQRFEPETSLLWEKFTQEDLKNYAVAAQSDMQRCGQAFYKTLHEEAGLKWERPADPQEKNQ